MSIGSPANKTLTTTMRCRRTQLPKAAKLPDPGWQRMKDELYHLVHRERPEIVNIVSWAASNGDRSENGDYLYGKSACVIDRRIRF